MRIFRKFQTTSKVCKTGVKEKKIVLPTIYDKHDKLIAFICEKIQYYFSCNLKELRNCSRELFLYPPQK